MEFTKLIVVATENEFAIAKRRFPEPILVTGVGGLNVIKALSNVDRNEHIVNFGFAGSNNIPIGEEIRVGTCKLYHPNVEYAEPEYVLFQGGTPCYTSNDFVLETKIEEPCLFDMELAYILALGFEDVSSIKIVSDNLSLKQYEEGVKVG